MKAGRFGAYVGEVCRKNHGATWGAVMRGGRREPGLRPASGVNRWPAGRVLDVITGGPDNDIASFPRKLAVGPAKN